MRTDKYSKKILFLCLLSVIVISSIMFVSAAATAPMTADNVTVCNRQKICDSFLNEDDITNVSFNSAYLNQNWSSINVYIYSTGATANTSVFLLNYSKGVRSNSSNNISVTVNVTSLEDGNDYTIIWNLWNGSDHLNKTVTGYVVDNGEPSAATSLLPTSDTDGIVNFSSTVTNADTTGCYINFSNYNPGKPSYNGSYYTTSCSYYLTGIPELSYLWYITTSDGNNATRSSVQTTNIDIGTSSSEKAGAIEESKSGNIAKSLSIVDSTGSLTGSGYGLIIGVIALIVIGIFVFKKKK